MFAEYMPPPPPPTSTITIAFALWGLSVDEVSLSHSLVPYKGFVQITIDGTKKNVCWQPSRSFYIAYTACRDLGYYTVNSYVYKSAPVDFEDSTFSGIINCNRKYKYLSQCSIDASSSEGCSGLLYIECKYKRRGQSNAAQKFPC